MFYMRVKIFEFDKKAVYCPIPCFGIKNSLLDCKTFHAQAFFVLIAFITDLGLASIGSAFWRFVDDLPAHARPGK